jgi:hypothetical protein
LTKVVLAPHADPRFIGGTRDQVGCQVSGSVRRRICPKPARRQVSLGGSAVLDHGRLVLANVLFPRWFQRSAKCVCTVVSEGARPRLHGATRFRPRSGSTSSRGRWRHRECRWEPGDAAGVHVHLVAPTDAAGSCGSEHSQHIVTVPRFRAAPWRSPLDVPHTDALIFRRSDGRLHPLRHGPPRHGMALASSSDHVSDY